jgi:Cu2+-exporting ATPase
MKHTYTITGMSCDGCRGKVEKTLNAIEGVGYCFVRAPNSYIVDKHIPNYTVARSLSLPGIILLR